MNRIGSRSRTSKSHFSSKFFECGSVELYPTFQMLWQIFLCQPYLFSTCFSLKFAISSRACVSLFSGSILLIINLLREHLVIVLSKEHLQLILYRCNPFRKLVIDVNLLLCNIAYCLNRTMPITRSRTARRNGVMKPVPMNRKTMP